MHKAPFFVAAVGLTAALVIVGGSSAMASAPRPGHTQLVSASAADPALEGDNTSQKPSISADGRYVAFASSATNLTNIPPTGINNSQVYVRDTMTGETTMVSSNGGVAGDKSSLSPCISADGNHVAYISSSTNLAPGYTDMDFQVLLWSRSTLSNELVSVSTTAKEANALATSPALSSDGTVVVFSSRATNLKADDTLGVAQVFSHDQKTGVTTLVSTDGGSPKPAGSAAAADTPSISADGAFVSFLSAGQLTLTPTGGHRQVYVRDISAGATQMASATTVGFVQPGDNETTEATLSADGHAIAFSSASNNLLPAFPHPGLSQVYVRDLRSNVMQLASLNFSGTAAIRGSATSASLSADGTRVAFVTVAHDILAEHPSYTDTEVYVRDLAVGTTRLASPSWDGTGFENGDCGDPVLTADGTTVAFSSNSRDLLSEPAPGGPLADVGQVYVRNLADPMARWGGADRYEVSASVSTHFVRSAPPVVYVATGATYPDALSASAIAGAQGAPVLLVTKDAVPPAIDTELTRLAPHKIVVLGGTESISADVETTLKSYSPVVERIGGADRYAVSAALSASQFSPGVSVAYIATGASFPDALSGSAAAGHNGAPVLLVTHDSIPTPIGDELARLRPAKIVILGGPASVSDDVLTALTAYAPASRIGGADRYEASAAISAATFPADLQTVYIASGANFPDALSGSACAIASGSPVLLVMPDSIPTAIATELRRLHPERIIVIGGPVSVSDAVYAQLKSFTD
jgi:putative cell wall-binding protein/Tol biopolymer transport system component